MRKNHFSVPVIRLFLFSCLMFLPFSQGFSQDTDADLLLEALSDSQNNTNLVSTEEIQLHPDEAAALGGEGLQLSDPVPQPVKTSLLLESAPVEAAEPITETVTPVLPVPAVPANVTSSVMETKPVPAPAANSAVPAPGNTALPVPAAAPVTQTVPGEPINVCRECNGINFGTGAWRNRIGTRPVPAPIFHAPVHRPGIFATPDRGGRFGGFRRQPMIDPYYTLRGPRHFNDPNPRPVGP
ncbi:MAG: hypothetical protein Q4C96_02440 [Planctomycetia bacterium]|nr:hypothetical protein [Planctomycetia bacterium]